MLPTNDYIFKRIFGLTGNEIITTGLIGSIIKKEIITIKINENPITEKDMKDDKVGVLDLKAKLNDEIVCNVEVQVVQEKDIDKRIMFYWGKIYTGEIKEGEKYSILKKTIVILIAKFQLRKLKEIPKYHTKWQVREEEFRRILLTDTLEIHIIELPKLIKQLENNIGNKKDEVLLYPQLILNPENVGDDMDKYDKKLALWVLFLLNPDLLSEKILEENEDIRLAKEEFDKIRYDEHEIYLAELRQKHIRDTQAVQDYGFECGLERGLEEGRERGLEEGREKGLEQGMAQGMAQGIAKGIEQGMEQGKKNNQFETAKRLINLKIPIEQIMLITELTEEEIKSIK